MGEVDLGQLTFLVDSSNNIFSCRIPNMKVPTTYEERQQGIRSSIYPVSHIVSINTNMDDKSMLRYGGFIYIRDTSYTDVTSFTAAVSGVQLVYELATPSDFQREPQPVSTLEGENNIWSNAGTVTAYVPADDLIDQVTPQKLNTAEGDNTITVTAEVEDIVFDVTYRENNSDG